MASEMTSANRVLGRVPSTLWFKRTAGAQEKHDLPAVGLGDGIEGHHPAGDKVDGVLVGVQALKAAPGQVGPAAVVFHLKSGAPGRPERFGPDPEKMGMALSIGGDGGQAVHENAPSSAVPLLYHRPGRKGERFVIHVTRPGGFASRPLFIPGLIWFNSRDIRGNGAIG